MTKQKHFILNESVVVLAKGGWKRNCKGHICSEPEPIKTLQGADFFYWVQFDEPEEDINGSDKYSKAQILSQYIERIKE